MFLEYNSKNIWDFANKYCVNILFGNYISKTKTDIITNKGL